MNTAMPDRTLCVVVCGAGPASQVGTLVDLAHRDHWQVRLVATPVAMTFLNTDALATQAGTPVRADYRKPGEPGTRSSAADALIVAPATYNTINKLALGINDTYALNVVAEAIGRGTPVAILPFVNTSLASRRPFRRSVDSLRAEGVHVLIGPGDWQPHPPGTGGRHIASFPWHRALTVVSNHGPIPTPGVTP